MANKLNAETELQAELTKHKARAKRLEQVVRSLSATKKQQNALFRIVDLANSSNSLPAFYFELHKIVSELTLAKSFFIMLLHPEGDFVSFPYYKDDEDEQQKGREPLYNPTKKIPKEKLAGTATMKVIEERNLLHLNRVGFENMTVTGRVPEDWIGVPLIIEGQLLGALIVQSYDEGFRYDKRDEELLVYVSQHIATSLKRKQDAESLKEAHKKLQNHNRELEVRVAGRTEELKKINITLANEAKERRKSEKIQKALFKITDLVSTARNLNDLFVGVHQTISELMYANNAFIALLSEDKSQLEFPYFVDQYDERPGNIELALDGPQFEQGLTTQTLISGKSLLYNSSEGPAQNQVGAEAVSWLGVPLKDKKDVFGVIVIQSYDLEQVYEQQHLSLLETVAHQVSTAILRKKDSDALMKAHEHLERRVKERTSVLEKTIANRRKIEKRLEHESLHDSLTLLPNRRYLSEELNIVLKGKVTGQSCDVALLFLDLDRFKIINDSLGHHIGDLFLIEVAKILKNCMREDDKIVRLGGDEFCILMYDIYSVKIVVTLAERVLNKLRKPVVVGQHSLITSASIGVRLATIGEDSSDRVIGDADSAMYQAKHGGKDRYCLFDANVRKIITQRLKIEQDLRVAIGTEQLTLYYQPVIDLFSHRVVGLEALIRWQHPELGFIGPAEFIPIAEETGLIQELGESVVSMACETLSEFSKIIELKELYININISAMQILTRTLDNFIRKEIAKYGIDPNNLNAEITESILVEDFNAAILFVQELKSIGMKVLLDDFGTGYSSLSYLHQFPFDIIKLDQSFIQLTDENEKLVGMIESIGFLVSSLGMDIVVEGIETESQLELAQNLNCRYGQGYLFAKPMPKTEVLTFIKTC